jgi:hypothetical protein
MKRWWLGCLIGVAVGSSPALAAPVSGVPAVGADATEEEEEEGHEGFTLPPTTEIAPPLVFMGYIDVGYAAVEGNGTSYPPLDTRLPVDYGVDTFAPAVNSRGDVASTESPLYANGFLPRSVNTAGRPSFLLNTVNFDARYLSQRVPIMAFTRVQFLPRWGGAGRGNQTLVNVEQAFARVTPITGTELFVSAGKFDSVFGIEYLENQANFRTNITPTLFARYTTGTSVGVKAFYRYQIAPAWSAVSLNTAVTNSGTFIEALQPPDVSFTGTPVVSSRLGYELNLPRVQVKLGGSGLYGPRNDQRDRRSKQKFWGVDGRVNAYGVSFSAEYDDIREDLGSVGKETGLGGYELASKFHAHGFWGQAAYSWHAGLGPLTALTGYFRYEQRNAVFEGFRPIKVSRLTAGVRVDLWDALLLKAEVLFNQELDGAPKVDNDVATSSLVYSW